MGTHDAALDRGEATTSMATVAVGTQSADNMDRVVSMPLPAMVMNHEELMSKLAHEREASHELAIADSQR